MASRALRRGGGTTVPGTVARLVHPQIAGELSARLRHGCVLVTGTNGKTTTTRLMAAVLRRAGRGVVHNRAGANLMTGVTAALLNGRGDTGLFEVDEATLPAAISEVQPHLVVGLNLFRDQLDRYGELNALADKWRAALAGLPRASTVLLNADDPLVASLGAGLSCRVAYFGMDAPDLRNRQLQHSADSILCPACGTLLAFEGVYYGHLGHYHCPGCSFSRPEPQFTARAVQLSATLPSSAAVGDLRLDIPLPGLYNVYNTLAAVAASLTLGIAPELIAQAVREFRGAFGRTETVDIEGKRLRLLLAKNPVGFNEIIRTLLLDEGPLHLGIGLNDRAADGEDVSWIWDVDLEQLSSRCAAVVVSGTRADDMAVRLKYAGFPASALVTVADPGRAMRELLERTPPGQDANAIVTYTAMLDLRRALAAMGAVRHFWQD